MIPMPEYITLIFRIKMRRYQSCLEQGQNRVTLAALMDEITEIYAWLCGISYDEAANVLHSEEDNDD